MVKLTTVRHQGVCKIGRRVDVYNSICHHLQYFDQLGYG